MGFLPRWTGHRQERPKGARMDNRDPVSDFADKIRRIRFDPARQAGAMAAVLVPVILHAIPTLLFTRRGLHLSRHPGQVCFPGGMREPTDADLFDTALRETQEETGISPGLVSVLGSLNPVETLLGQTIFPVVGLLGEGFQSVANAEVAEIFEVPLPFFFDPANRQPSPRIEGKRMLQYCIYCYKNHRIEGATGRQIGRGSTGRRFRG